MLFRSLKRCNYMLQQGNYVADVAYFIGEDAPIMTGITEPALPAGYQFDFINAEVIEENLSANKDHTLSLPHGTQYRLLVLPPSLTMRPAVLKKIKITCISSSSYYAGKWELRNKCSCFRSI